MLHYSRNHSGTGCGSENAKHYLCGIDSSSVVLRMAYKGQGLVYPYALLYWRLCTGLLVPLGVIVFKYGVQAYPEMIASLFGMTDTATDYKPTSMIRLCLEIIYSIVYG